MNTIVDHQIHNIFCTTDPDYKVSLNSFLMPIINVLKPLALSELSCSMSGFVFLSSSEPLQFVNTKFPSSSLCIVNVNSRVSFSGSILVNLKLRVNRRRYTFRRAT